MLGEFFMVIEPFSNMDLEDMLGKMGVEVTRHASFSDWAQGVADSRGVGDQPWEEGEEGGGSVSEPGRERGRASDPRRDYPPPKEGFDGIIHLLPFTCMPEIIAQSIMPQVTKDHDIPVMSIVLDEQMGRAGFVTRVEAFVDLMQRRRSAKRKAAAIRA